MPSCKGVMADGPGPLNDARPVPAGTALSFAAENDRLDVPEAATSRVNAGEKDACCGPAPADTAWVLLSPVLSLLFLKTCAARIDFSLLCPADLAVLLQDSTGVVSAAA